ncbi:hypothetical protein F4803DRAFT_547176 [Xylaria telfairii]|nr:hypothetical protein F4803DRAFT_547176 [Xylaria telfairii]
MVARFGPTILEYASQPDVKSWIVKRKTDPNKPFRFWSLPEEYDAIRQIYPDIAIEEGRGSFIWGYPQLDLAIPIHTVGTSKDRPKYLYRLIHDGQPHGGIKARGYGLVIVDPFSFHILLRKHLDWRCRNPSPFLSATDSLDKIDHIYRLYIERGYRNIRFKVFRTDGPGWDHEKQKMYHVPRVLKEMDDRSPKYIEIMGHEYLIEGEIPLQSIIMDVPYESGDPQPPKKKPTPPKRKSPMSTDPDDERKKRRRAKGFKPLI